MTKRGLNFNSQTGTGQEQIHAATGGISVCRRTQTPGAWVHAARPPRGRSTAQWLLCLVCRRRISKSGRRMKGLVLSVCISLSVHSVSPGRGKHFILHFYAQPRASPAFQHCVCDCLNVEYYSFQHVCTCTSQENNSKPTPMSSTMVILFQTQLLIWEAFDSSSEQGHDPNHSQRGPIHWPQRASVEVLCWITHSHYY